MLLFVLNSDSNDEIKRQTILQSSMNPGSNNNNNPENKSDSDVNMEDYSESSDSSSDHPETPEEVRNRNERDLDTVESLIDENKRLKDLFGTAEKIRDKKSISETEYGNYLHANSPTLNNLEAEIRRNEEEIERLEEKLVERRQPDYVPSDDSSESGSSESSNSVPVSPDSSNNNGSALSDTVSPLSSEHGNIHPPFDKSNSFQGEDMGIILKPL